MSTAVAGRVSYTTVYTTVYTAYVCTRPCKWPVHGRVHVYKTVYRPCPRQCTQPYTRLYRRPFTAVYTAAYTKVYTVGCKEKDKERNPNSSKLGVGRDHPRRRIEVKCCMVGGLQMIVLWCKFDQNRFSGFGAAGTGGCEICPSPLTWPLAYTTACRAYYRTSRDADIIFLPCGFFLSSIFFFYSSPNLSGRRLDVYHTSTHGVALVRI